MCARTALGPAPLRSRGLGGLATLFLVLLLAACGGDPDEPSDERGLPQAPRVATLSGGQLIYFEAGCYLCHGEQAEGGLGPSLARTALSLDEWLGQVRFPVGGMHRFAYDDLSNDEAAAVRDFVRTIRASTPLPRDRPPLTRASGLTALGPPPFDLDQAQESLDRVLQDPCPLEPDRAALIPPEATPRIDALLGGSGWVAGAESWEAIVTLDGRIRTARVFADGRVTGDLLTAVVDRGCEPSDSDRTRG